MRLINFASTDGGVGILTPTALRADGLFRKGESIRLIDLDPKRPLNK
ncbi:MAG: cellulose biosynthesis protein BcsQ [Loktanella salsilacus]|jgi:cellulose biosynthesis protein BcsQ